MARETENAFDKMRQFLCAYLKEGEPFKASTAYREFLNSGQATDEFGRTISQKYFAMFLRTEVLKKNGMLKRTAHGIYEKRMDPEDHGVAFTRKEPECLFDADEAYLDSIPVTQADARLDKLYEDAVSLTARIRFAMQSLQKISEVYPEYKLELASYYEGLMKDMDRVAAGLSAMMAWCEDHTDEILVAGDVHRYLESDAYSREFTSELLDTANSDDEIRDCLIGKRRAYAEQYLASEEQDHDWDVIADPENGITEMDGQCLGESMTLSW